MKFQIDEKFLIDCFRDIVEVPSPVGYDLLLKPVLENYAAQFGQTITYDNRGTAYITLDGQDNSKTVLIGAHVDTIGLMVRCIQSDGTLLVRALGGINFCNIEASTVTVYTRDGRSYTGMVICKAHSVHVTYDARTMPRNDETMCILLDEDVHSKAEVQALGIQNGDYIHIAPDCEFTKTGYLKSRFVDDKISVACCFTMLKYLAENNLKPKYRTVLAFTYQEETGIGGRYVPDGVSEYIALDVGLIGPELESNEHSVGIVVKDRSGTYSYDLVDRLIDCAKKTEVKYALGTILNGSTDGTAALLGGNNLKVAAFGTPCYSTHGRERTHIDGIVGTAQVLLAYALDI